MPLIQSSSGSLNYDYQGRRFSKKVYTGTPGNWALSNEYKFVYDGYQQITEFDGSDALQRSYVWLGDSPGWVKDGSNCYYYIVDGYKNVRALTDSTGAVVAEYSYNPFGKIISQAGGYANDNKYRFSSEYFNPVLNSYDYGFRDYRVDLMRWTTRDPIEEQGGANLYGFVNNNPVSYLDFLGLELYAVDGSGLDETFKSNVWKFVRRYLDGEPYYYRGVGNPTDGGAGGKPWGAGASELVKEIVCEICGNFRKGKVKIDIVGFSRGAAIANEVAHELERKGCGGLKAKPKVRFLGLFDTVHSFNMLMGWLWQDKNMAGNVRNSAHAISLDENRSLFRLSPLTPSDSAYSQGGSHVSRNFHGIHSDIGGTMNPYIGALVLRWMIDQAIGSGVKMNTKGLATLQEFEELRRNNPELFTPSQNSGPTNFFTD